MTARTPGLCPGRSFGVAAARDDAPRLQRRGRPGRAQSRRRVAAGHIAFIDDAGRYTYGELAQRVNRCANAWRRLGIARRGPRRPAAARQHRFPDGVSGRDPRRRRADPVQHAAHCRRLRISAAPTAARGRSSSPRRWRRLIAPLAARLAALEHVIVSGGAVARHAGRFADWIAAESADAPVAATTADDVCFWLYSSGSTGSPKGAVHLHADLIQTAELYARPVLGIAPDDVVFSAAKLFFAYGLGNALTFPLAVGATSVLMAERPTPAAVFKRLVGERPTIFYGVPTLYAAHAGQRRISAARPTRPAPLRFRRRGAAGRPRQALARQDRRRHPRRAGLDRDAAHLPVQSSRRRVLRHHRQAGARLRPARRRRGRQSGRAPARSASCRSAGRRARRTTGTTARRACATFLGPWTQSGDKYIVDADGRYVYCGRTDDMLKVGGVYVSPFEVEAALATHDAVLEAAVVGRADASELIKPKAFVVLKPGRRRRGPRWRRRCRSTSSRGSRRSNIRAGSSSSTSCRRPRPARSSASSCARRLRA